MVLPSCYTNSQNQLFACKPKANTHGSSLTWNRVPANLGTLTFQALLSHFATCPLHHHAGPFNNLYQFSRSVVANSLWPHGLQDTRLPCLPPTPGAASNSCPTRWCHHFMANRWGNNGRSERLFLGGGSKITADGDCSHEIKRCLLIGRKTMTNLDSILKSRDITLPTKVRLVKAMVFPVVMYGCEMKVGL